MTNEELEKKSLNLENRIESLEKQILQYGDIKKFDLAWLIIFVCISAVALGLSIFSLCRVIPNTPDLDVDYSGIIVGILSLLVTVLLGWQIFQSVNFHNRIKNTNSKIDKKFKYKTLELKHIKNKVTDECIKVEKVQADVCNLSERLLFQYSVIGNSLIDIYDNLYKTSKSNDILLQLVFISLNTIVAKSQLDGDLYLIADHTIEKLINILQQNSEFECSFDDKNMFMSMLDNIQHHENLLLYDELKRMLIGINVK